SRRDSIRVFWDLAPVLRLLLLGALLVGWVPPAFGRVIPVGPVVPVDASGTVEAQAPQVVALSDGSFVVLWHGIGANVPPFTPPAIGRHFDANGNPMGKAFQFQGVSRVVEVTAAGSNLLLSWADDSDLMVGRFTPDGAALGATPVHASNNIGGF